MDYLKEAKKIEKEIIKNRRELHKRAEVGLDTPRTFEFIEKKLRELGYEPKRLGESGLIARVGGRDENAVLLRADVDALPIEEKTSLSFACASGNMHACGHDTHAAVLLGAAKLLKNAEGSLKRPVLLLFQSGEEILEGAKEVIKNGLLEQKIACALTLHALPATDAESGSIAVPEGGVVAPSADFFEIEVVGKSCHGSSPQEGVDATLVGAHILLALEEITTREIGGSALAVLTIGKFQSGSAYNVISAKAVLGGTLRMLDEEIRAKMKRRLEEISKAVAKAFGARAKIRFKGGCPSLLIDGETSERLREIAQKTLNNKLLPTLKTGVKIGGSEDFAYISRTVPSATFALCAGGKSDGYVYPLHHPKTDFDESAFVYGAALFCAFAAEY